MLANRWDEARLLLVDLHTPESSLAADWVGTGRDFFSNLDSRTASFFLAARASYDWNSALRDLASAHCPRLRNVQIDGLDFSFVDSTEAAAQVMAAAPELPSLRYMFSDGVAKTRMSTRASVTQTTVEIGPWAEDDHFIGMSKVELSFFLPSGSYATSAVRQMLMQL